MAAYAGAATLVRFALRRSRFALLWWVLGIAVLYPLTAASLQSIYPTQADLDALAASLQGNASIIAIAGPDLALNTIGGQTAWQTSAFGAILFGLMSTFLIVRHTRAGEESGTDELIRAGVVGRNAPTAAAITVTAAANLTLVVVIAMSLLACGLPASGSWALAIAGGFTGLVFMAAALVFAQVATTSRGAWGMSGAAIGVAYALRAAGDASGSFLTWLSPIGWGQQMRAYADERWWPAALLLGATAAGLLLAHVLHERRDFGAGLVAARGGPVDRAWPLGAYGLAWRLDRSSAVGWLLGLTFGGLAYGTLGNDVSDLIGQGGDLADSLTGGQTSGAALVDGFYGSAVLLLAIITSGFGVSLVLRARSEEIAGRVEPLLATSLPRRRFLAGHVVAAVLVATCGVALAGAATGLMYGIVTGTYGRVGQLALAALTYAPAIWVLIALAAALFGLLPRLTPLAWLGVGFTFVIMFFGPLLHFPNWLTTISPFSHLPLVPLQTVSWAPLVGLTTVAGVLFVVAFTGFRRRDVPT